MTSALARMVRHHPLAEALRIEQVLHAHALARRLVGVGRPDPAAGGADLALAQLRLLHVVEHDVVGHDEMGLARDLQVGRGDTPALEIVDLLAKHGGIDDHPVADDGHDLGVEYAGGDQVEGELAALVLHGVTGVVAALIADHHVGLLAQQVGDLAFAFIAPLGAHHHENRHDASRSTLTLETRRPSRRRSARLPVAAHQTVYTRVRDESRAAGVRSAGSGAAAPRPGSRRAATSPSRSLHQAARDPGAVADRVETRTGVWRSASSASREE